MGDPGETGKAEGINQPEPPSEQQEEGRDPRVREDTTAGTEQTKSISDRSKKLAEGVTKPSNKKS